MKYRVIQNRGGNLYFVQYRQWWSWWTTDRHYESHDKPREVMKYGGFFSDIGYKATEYGSHTKWFDSQALAKKRIEQLKRYRRQDKERESKKQEVVVYKDS